MRLLRATAHVCLLVLLFSLVTVLPASAYPVAASSSTAIGSRTFKAYQKEARTLFKVSFRTVLPNEKRRVMARVNVAVPKTASDPFLVATYYMYCAPAGTNRGDNKILGSQNVMRGKTHTHNPHYLYTAPTPGNYECWIRISSGRPRPAKTKPTSNVLTVGSGSYLQLTKIVHPLSKQAYAPKEPSPLVPWNRSADVAVLETTVPLLTDEVTVSGDLWLTSCTAKEGSTDPVTGKRLCEGRINRAGTKLVSRVVVAQRKLLGDGYCKTTQFPSAAGRTTNISADLHHAMIFENGTAKISRSPGCSRKIRVKIYVKHSSGAAFMIHNQGTISTAIMPDGSTI